MTLEKAYSRTRPTFFSLFSGIGGIDLAFARAGFEIIGQVEIEPFARVIYEELRGNV